MSLFPKKVEYPFKDGSILKRGFDSGQ